MFKIKYPFEREAEGSSAGGGVGSSDRGDSSNRDTSSGSSSSNSSAGSDNDHSNSFDNSGTDTSDVPSTSELESSFDNFGEDTDTFGGFDPQGSNQFSVSPGSFGGFDDGLGSTQSENISGTTGFSEGFAQGIDDAGGAFSSGFKQPAADIRGFGEKVDDFFSFELPKFADEFTAAPLDTLSDLVSNPFVGGAASLLGGGLLVGGIKIADAVADAFQGEQSMFDAAKQALGGAISSPLGSPLGVAQGLAANVAQSPMDAVKSLSAFAGGQVGATAGTALASTFGNPYATAIGGAVGAFAGGKGGAVVGENIQDSARGIGGPSEDSPSRIAQNDRDSNRTSPLLQGGPRAPEADATKLASNVDINKFNRPEQVFNPYVGGTNIG